MNLRHSTLYLALTATLLLAVAALVLHAASMVRASEGAFGRKRALVRRAQLTDLCLCTEANYTRNPALTDMATPFQDAPLSLDHFPSGGLIAPPSHLMRAKP